MLDDNFVFFVGFLIKFDSRKQFFGLTWSETFFSIQLFFLTICVSFCIKDPEMVTKAFSMNAIKKLSNIFSKKSFSVFKGAIFSIFEHTYTFFGQTILLFFYCIYENAFATNSEFFIQQNKRVVKKVSFF